MPKSKIVLSIFICALVIKALYVIGVTAAFAVLVGMLCIASFIYYPSFWVETVIRQEGHYLTDSDKREKLTSSVVIFGWIWVVLLVPVLFLAW